MHYRIQELCRVPGALDEAQKTLGKGFAECHTRQTTLGEFLSETDFAECFLSDTRRRLRRVPKKHSANFFFKKK